MNADLVFVLKIYLPILSCTRFSAHKLFILRSYTSGAIGAPRVEFVWETFHLSPVIIIIAHFTTRMP